MCKRRNGQNVLVDQSNINKVQRRNDFVSEKRLIFRKNILRQQVKLGRVYGYEAKKQVRTSKDEKDPHRSKGSRDCRVVAEVSESG